MKIPASLKPGDKIAIVSPASVVNPDYIDGASAFFEARGFCPVIMPHAKGPASGSYAATDSDRLKDITDAYGDPAIRAILCARGGYGCNHLLPFLPPALIASDPKWLIGFSDVSALHALSSHAGIVSLHAPMAKHLATMPIDDISTLSLMKLLTQGLPHEYNVKSHPLNVSGEAEGILVGGNLAVINGLADTPYDPLNIPGPKILFMEDIGEHIYEVERMLIRIILSGRFDEIAGIICGQFTNYSADRNFQTMEEMIANLLSPDSPLLSLAPGNTSLLHSLPSLHRSKLPIALGFPSGHTDCNLPLPIGAKAKLTVRPDNVTLQLS